MSVAIFKGKLVKFLAKAGILVPTRTELERPDTPAAGEMAFNTDSNVLEVYTGSNWANSVKSDLTGIAGADAVVNIVTLTQAEYDAITMPSATTIYFIVE